MDLNAALKWLNTAVMNKVGHSLREPELVILKGTWRGLTYEQMAEGSDYSTNYLMRDVAPKLWKQLSSVFGRSVGKTNFRVALEAYAAANASDMELDIAAASPSSHLPRTGFSGLASGGAKNPYLHPSILPGAAFAASTTADAISRLSRPSVSAATMYGYTEELAQIKQWLSDSFSTGAEPATDPNLGSPSSAANARTSARLSGERAAAGQLVGIWGLRGVGKTLLAEKVVAQIGDRFEGIVWRSLQSQPSLNELSASILASLGISAAVQPTAQLLALMAQRSLLIVIESVEAILQSDHLAGGYLPTHQGYSEFFQSVMGSQSCVILTGIEGPTELMRYSTQRHQGGGHSLSLSRLSAAAAAQLLSAELSGAAPTSETDADSIGFPESFSIVAGAIVEPPPVEPPPPPQADPSKASWPELIERYQGHPLALKSACRVVREIFNGQVDEFLKQTSLLFTDILRLLAPSFKRLTPAERNVLYWLASQDSPLSIAELQEIPSHSLGSSGLISVLDSLRQRSLLEISSGDPDSKPDSKTDTGGKASSPRFYLSALVKAYAVHQFMGRFADRSATTPTGQSAQSEAAPDPAEQIISLSPSPAAPVQLSQWFAGHFAPAWQSLNQLFQGSARPAMRLRSTYHLQDETFVKRCKSIDFNAPNFSANADKKSSDTTKEAAKATLIVAIHQDTESLYKLCVQAQPSKEDTVLPPSLALKLLDTQQKVLATVTAEQDDTFIQLPYFRGALTESFTIELALGDRTHTESFII